MLKLCRLSGCAALFFGLESVSPSSLIGMKKSLKSIEETEEAIKIIQDNGIAFHPSLILGFDTDTKAIFDDTLEFLARTKLPTMALHVLTPYPGTRIYQRFKDQGRIISHDWSHYDHHTVVFQPKNMTPRGACRRTPSCPKRVLFFLFDPSAYSISFKSLSYQPQAEPAFPVT